MATPIREVPDLRSDQFQPRGGTPLIDAACDTIRAVRESLDGREDVKVIFAIQTDGQENASRENGWDGLRALIADCEKGGWQFNFMGCGIDAYGQGARMGIRAENTISYGADQAATVAAFAATAENTRLYASGARADMSYTREQKMRSGDRFDPEARGASGAGHPGDRGARLERPEMSRAEEGGSPPEGRAAPGTGEGTAFGAALSDLLWDYRKRQTDLSRELGTSTSYVNALKTGKKAAAAPTVDRIADALGACPEDRVRLHRAAARDAGFKLDLPEGF